MLGLEITNSDPLAGGRHSEARRPLHLLDRGFEIYLLSAEECQSVSVLLPLREGALASVGGAREQLIIIFSIYSRPLC